MKEKNKSKELNFIHTFIVDFEKQKFNLIIANSTSNSLKFFGKKFQIDFNELLIDKIFYYLTVMLFVYIEMLFKFDQCYFGMIILVFLLSNGIIY